MTTNSEAPVEKAGAHHADLPESGVNSSLPIRYDNPWPIFAMMVCLYGLQLRLSSSLTLHAWTFNSMLDHLLRGRFDVDPRVVGDEGFLRNGQVYAYWGVWCALLRFPLWLVHRLDVNMTAFSCLAANAIAVAARVSTVLLIRKHAPPTTTSKMATATMLAYILTGGSAISYLKASVYQEVVSWAVAFAAIFVYFSVKGLVERHFSPATLRWMALCAGLALLTRVSTGIGLTLAFGLLLPVLAIGSNSAEAPGSKPIGRARSALFVPRFLLPVGILFACIAATGAVNYFRWGNPLVFADYHHYIGNALWPDRVSRLATYGNFNYRRIPIAVLYYFLPLWAIPTPGGSLLFENSQFRLFDDIELPPCTFLLTDLVALSFIVFFTISIWKRRAQMFVSSAQCGAIAAGLLAPCLLMLTAISLTFRYRMEFYPEFDFLAFLGLYLVLVDNDIQEKFVHSRTWVKSALIITVAASLAAFVLYLMSPFGPAAAALRAGAFHWFAVRW